MTTQMFCFQCEQTAGGKGCIGAAGVCGKTAATAALQDELTGALITLATVLPDQPLSRESKDAVLTGLFATLTNVNFNNENLQQQIQQAHQLIQQQNVAAVDYDMQRIWQADDNIRSLKSLLLFGMRGVAAYAYHANVLGYEDETIYAFLLKGLRALAQELTMEQLLPLALECGQVNLTCMALLDQANTATFGNPEPTTVSFTVEPGPFIIVTGHDLYDLQQLLEQTKGKGVAVYTHGEMLPAHAYPALKAYPHLKGHFGTAWQNQQTEFANLPGAVLYTTNCLMPTQGSYADRIFTTEAVSYPGVTHIGADKDFTPVIEKALALGGYNEPQFRTGMNGGSQTVTGFGHQAVLSAADTIVDAVKQGVIGHFFLVAGCDGKNSKRSYYRDFVQLTPSDSVILTLACGKFRFHDLDLGTVAGLPRLLDMGQCNDAYSAIQVAVALADAFGCGVNDLPLSMVLSWYEQKAVCILLSLLHLGIKDIYLGPSLPAFLSDDVLQLLVKEYNIHPISTPEQDLAQML